jgi:hypothetical protein
MEYQEQVQDFARKLNAAGYEEGQIVRNGNGTLMCCCSKHLSSVVELDCMARYISGNVNIYFFGQTIYKEGA